MQVHGCEGRSLTELEQELAAGGRFVYYEYCISLIVLTLRRPTRVYYLGPEETGLARALPWVLVSLCLGWWGLPWGVLYTPLTLLTNLGGGCDVTDEVWAYLKRQAALPSP